MRANGLRGTARFMYLVNFSGRPVSPGLELVGETNVVNSKSVWKPRGVMYEHRDFSTTIFKVINQVIQCISMRNSFWTTFEKFF